MIVLFVLFFLVACGSRQNQIEQPAAPSLKKLEKKYDTLLFSAFTATHDIATDYPQAAKELQSSAMTALLMENRFKRIGTTSEDLTAGGNTLFVKADITELRIVSGIARFFARALAGRSGVEMDIQLIDSATQEVVIRERVSSWNNPFGATWTGGLSDRTILNDMGKIMAQYIIDSMPEK